MTAEWQMPEVPADERDPRVRAALNELRSMILHRYPMATFTISHGDDPEGIFLNVIIDIDDLDEVADVVTGRLVDMQVEEGLPVYVIPEWPPERIRAYWQERASQSNSMRTPAVILP